MIGIIIQLVLSWILLRWIEKKDLRVLGLAPTPQRLKDFGIGLLLPILYFVALFVALSYLGGNPYYRNPEYTTPDFLQALWYLFKSVAFETLIFNGALLYVLARRVGTPKAVLISAIAFGIYHWFSWNLFGQPVGMVLTFLTTGMAGYLWALAYVKTGSIYLPFALHYGVDFAFSIVFSKDKSIGDQLFIPTYESEPQSPGTIVSIVMLLLYYIGFPLLTFLYLRTLKERNRETVLLVDQNDTTLAERNRLEQSGGFK